MPAFQYRGIKIAGVQATVPELQIHTTEFENRFGKEVVEKFSSTTGIKAFYRAAAEQTASDLAFAAAKELLDKKRIDRKKIKALIFVTQSPDYRRPASSCVLQKRLGLDTDCAVLDINLGCSGFIYGLQNVCAMMSTSDIDCALLVLGETATKIVNPNDQSVAMMFGDAGAAILLEKSGNEEKIRIELRSDGARFKSIILPAGGFRDMAPSYEEAICSDGNKRTLYDVYMNGIDVFVFSVRDVPTTIQAFLKNEGKAARDYDSCIFHQANGFILRQMARKLDTDMDRFPLSLDRYGNTGGVSIPLTLCDRYGSEPEGEKSVLMCGFGIGLSWGVASAVVGVEDIFPIIKTEDFYKEGKIKLKEL